MIGAMLGTMLVRRSYDAINQGDVAAIMANWNDEATLTYPGNLSVSGTRKGRGAIEAWFRHFVEAVPTRTFKLSSICVQNIFDIVGTNVIAAQWEDRPVNRAGESFHVRGVTVATSRWGKITSSTVYIFDPSVLPRIWGE